MKSKLLLLLFVPCIMFSQTKLGKAKESLSKTSKSSGSSSSSSNSSSDNDGDFDFVSAFFESAFLELMYYSTLGIAFGGGDYTEMNPYPYYNNHGEFTNDFNDNTKRSSIKIGGNYLINRINGVELNAVLKPIPIAGLDVSYLNFSESTLLNSESLNITSISANYYRVRENNFSIWWGIGGTYVGKEVDTWGFAYNLGVDIYPVKPISLHLGWRQSFINDNTVDVFKSQVKYHIKRAALYTGYHNYKLGSETISGLILGIEYSF